MCVYLPYSKRDATLIDFFPRIRSMAGDSMEANYGGQVPPFTRWSCTVIDYAFGRNIHPETVYIDSTAVSSDHLPWSQIGPTELWILLPMTKAQ